MRIRAGIGGTRHGQLPARSFRNGVGPVLDERVASSPVSTGFHGGISPLQRDEFRGRTIRETALCHRSLGVEALAELRDYRTPSVGWHHVESMGRHMLR